MNEKPSKWKVFTAGIIRENPVLRLVLGCCSALAVTTTVSGAVGMGVLDAIMCDDTYKELRDALELDRHSRVLMFSTEGNTDPEKYRRVVWDGEYPTDDTPQKPC